MSLLNLNPSNLLGSLISGSFSVKSLINDFYSYFEPDDRGDMER